MDSSFSDTQVTVKTLNCSQCGGLVQPVVGTDHLACTFCNSLAFSTEHPLAVDRITPTGTQLQTTCPCCEWPLTSGKIDDQPAAYCERCCGILMQKAQFAAAIRQRRARRTGNTAEESVAIDVRQYDRSLQCPSCQNCMEVHPYYGPGNVVIDSCSRCSLVWLDHGELGRLERAIGGDPGVRTSQMSEYGAAVVSHSMSCSTQAKPVHPLQLLADWLFG